MKTYYFATLLAILYWIPSCGQTEQQDSFSEESGDGTTPSGTPTSQQPIKRSQQNRNEKLVSIPVNFSYKGAPSEQGFNLASATSYSVSLDGCLSGYTSTATQNSTNLQVYKYDIACKAKLTTFVYDGVTYIPKTGSTFTTWAAGDVATFEKADHSLELFVRVVAQLANPVSGTEAVTYEFYDIDIGTTNTSLNQAAVGAGHAMSVTGDIAPSFTIKTVTYTGMEAGTGKGYFEFVMECSQDITGSTPNRKCKDIEMNAISYKLIEDTTTSVLTYAQAAALFAGSEDAVIDAADGTDEVFAVNESSVAHGGFTTKTGAGALKGPAALHTKPNMMVVFRANVTGNDTFLYFNVDITTLTQD